MSKDKTKQIVETEVVESTEKVAVVGDISPVQANPVAVVGDSTVAQNVAKDIAQTSTAIAINPETKELFAKVSDENLNLTDFLNEIGEESVVAVQRTSDMLDKPISNLSSEDESPILKNLTKIDETAKEISPSNFNFNPNFLVRIIDAITFSNRGTKFANKFRTGKDVISDVIKSLDEGKIMLKEDNIIFYEEMRKNRETALKLEEEINKLLVLNEMVTEKMNSLPEGKEKMFYQGTVNVKIARRIVDLQQVQSVCNQSLPAFKILIDSNEDLSRAIDSVKTVTVSALTIGMTIAMGLARQKKILERVKTIGETTNDLMDANANMLATQGVEISKQAGEAMIDIERMNAQMKKIEDAFMQIQENRAETLPKLQESIKLLKSSADSFNETVDYLKIDETLALEGGK